MNTEEKAKAYDEALEKARKRVSVEPQDHTDAILKDIFPELREEEKPLTPFQQCLNCILRGAYYAEVPDEKVNEFIVNVVKTRTDELVKLAKRHEYTDCQLCESEDERIRKAIKCYVEDMPDTYGFAHGIGKKEMLSYLEKQKEQKHYWKPTDTDVALFSKAVTTNKALTPTERAQLDIIRSKFGCCRAVNCSGIMQKEQKPAEWSEEEKDKVAQYLHDRDGGMLWSKATEITGDILDMLRPSWKPSEEQMNCLCAAVDAAIRKHNESVSGYKPARVLKSLYEQLKKL